MTDGRRNFGLLQLTSPRLVDKMLLVDESFEELTRIKRKLSISLDIPLK
jgi:hypothetical protein